MSVVIPSQPSAVFGASSCSTTLTPSITGDSVAAVSVGRYGQSGAWIFATNEPLAGDPAAPGLFRMLNIALLLPTTHVFLGMTVPAGPLITACVCVAKWHAMGF